MVRLAANISKRVGSPIRPDGVTTPIEGKPKQQQQLLATLDKQLPPFAAIKSLSITHQPQAGFEDFQIKSSLADGKQSAFVLPTCDLRRLYQRYF